MSFLNGLFTTAQRCSLVPAVRGSSAGEGSSGVEVDYAPSCYVGRSQLRACRQLLTTYLAHMRALCNSFGETSRALCGIQQVYAAACSIPEGELQTDVTGLQGHAGGMAVLSALFEELRFHCSSNIISSVVAALHDAESAPPAGLYGDSEDMARTLAGSLERMLVSLQAAGGNIAKALCDTSNQLKHITFPIISSASECEAKVDSILPDMKSLLSAAARAWGSRVDEALMREGGALPIPQVCVECLVTMYDNAAVGELVLETPDPVALSKLRRNTMLGGSGGSRLAIDAAASLLCDYLYSLPSPLLLPDVSLHLPLAQAAESNDHVEQYLLMLPQSHVVLLSHIVYVLRHICAARAVPARHLAERFACSMVKTTGGVPAPSSQCNTSIPCINESIVSLDTSMPHQRDFQHLSPPADPEDCSQLSTEEEMQNGPFYFGSEDIHLHMYGRGVLEKLLLGSGVDVCAIVNPAGFFSYFCRATAGERTLASTADESNTGDSDDSFSDGSHDHKFSTAEPPEDYTPSEPVQREATRVVFSPVLCAVQFHIEDQVSTLRGAFDELLKISKPECSFAEVQTSPNMTSHDTQTADQVTELPPSGYGHPSLVSTANQRWRGVSKLIREGQWRRTRASQMADEDPPQQPPPETNTNCIEAQAVEDQKQRLMALKKDARAVQFISRMQANQRRRHAGGAPKPHLTPPNKDTDKIERLPPPAGVERKGSISARDGSTVEYHSVSSERDTRRRHRHSDSSSFVDDSPRVERHATIVLPAKIAEIVPNNSTLSRSSSATPMSDLERKDTPSPSQMKKKRRATPSKSLASKHSVDELWKWEAGVSAPAIHKVGEGGFARISSAIIASSDGDTIVVGEGVFEESLFINKRVMITGQGPGTVITALVGIAVELNGDDCVLSNLTVDGRNGHPAVRCSGSKCVLVNCNITILATTLACVSIENKGCQMISCTLRGPTGKVDKSTGVCGGVNVIRTINAYISQCEFHYLCTAISIVHSRCRAENNMIFNTHSDSIFLENASGALRSNDIVKSGGDGCVVSTKSLMIIDSNLITAPRGVGVCVKSDAFPEIRNNEIVDPGHGSHIAVVQGGSPTILNNHFFMTVESVDMTQKVLNEVIILQPGSTPQKVSGNEYILISKKEGKPFFFKQEDQAIENKAKESQRDNIKKKLKMFANAQRFSALGGAGHKEP